MRTAGAISGAAATESVTLPSQPPNLPSAARTATAPPATIATAATTAMTARRAFTSYSPDLRFFSKRTSVGRPDST
ncbi:hypothetical protein GCM10007977_009640 [Dactylosporangium sucinum]|uniref:Uncharacterized protein n=1 Tax=Dactylosporangium sucinum TaxID=1424081 RepID=A0A917T4F3_9ACTN|nr:hypothetical protein GCM10007977_009640 [Dactylosporangium sucinum]